MRKSQKALRSKTTPRVEMRARPVSEACFAECAPRAHLLVRPSAAWAEACFAEISMWRFSVSEAVLQKSQSLRFRNLKQKFCFRFAHSNAWGALSALGCMGSGLPGITHQRRHGTRLCGPKKNAPIACPTDAPRVGR